MNSASIIDELKYRFKTGNMVTKLIFANLMVFVAFKLFGLVLFFAQSQGVQHQVAMQLAVPASLSKLIVQPWSVLTYMFFHEGFLHILFNMLWLFWFGEIFVLYLGDRKILPLYVLGGLMGVVFYLAAFNLFPVFSEQVPRAVMLGASASVLAIVFAAATINPEHEVRLLFFGDVRIKYIAFVSLLIDVISIPQGNAGGYIAHLGGALCGWLFIKGLRSGVDAGKPIGEFAEMVASQFSKEKMRVNKPASVLKPTHGSGSAAAIQRTQSEQERVDEILDKISRSGYDSLTKEEKEFLFHYSNK